MSIDRTVKLLYRGEWFVFRVTLEGYRYRATAYLEGIDVVATSELFESAGEAVASLVAGVMDATDFVHAEMAFEADREGMAAL